MLDPTPFVKDMVVSVKRAIAAALEPIEQRLEDFERRLLAVPAGKDGADGKDGSPGKDGEPGPAGKDAEPIDFSVIERYIDSGLVARLELIPPPKDGLRGEPGKDGRDGKDAEKAIDGRDGRDGLPGLAGKDGEKGADGKDGADGLGFDDLSVDYDGERAFAIKFQRGEIVKEFAFTLPLLLDRGVWRQNAYQPGDVTSYDGCMWIAQVATEDKPGTSKDWRLSVKRGRDARQPPAEPPSGDRIVRLR